MSNTTYLALALLVLSMAILVSSSTSVYLSIKVSRLSDRVAVLEQIQHVKGTPVMGGW